jgi:hypothetical protein
MDRAARCRTAAPGHVGGQAEPIPDKKGDERHARIPQTAVLDAANDGLNLRLPAKTKRENSGLS